MKTCTTEGQSAAKGILTTSKQPLSDASSPLPSQTLYTCVTATSLMVRNCWSNGVSYWN